MTTLSLYRATSFYDRLRGVWHQPLCEDDARGQHTGLWLYPCRAIHTLALPASLDILFLDSAHRIVRLVPSVPPNRMAVCRRATSVVELPGGWCQRHPDYANAIARAVDYCRRGHFI